MLGTVTPSTATTGLQDTRVVLVTKSLINLLSVARVYWMMKRREGIYWWSIVITSVAAVLPALLNARALAGPDEDQVDRFVYYTGQGDYLAFAAIGYSIAIWSGLTLPSVARIVVRERRLGLIATVWTTGASRRMWVLGCALGTGVGDTIIGLFIFAAAWMAFRFGIGLNSFVLMVLAFGFLANMMLAFALASAALRFREFPFVIEAIHAMAVVSSGALYPVDVLPDIFAALGKAFPLAWIIEGVRSGLNPAGGGDGVAVITSVVVLAVFSALFGVLGVLVFRWYEGVALRSGVLESY